MSAWSHLPNASHIDWVIESVKTNLQEWDYAYNAARDVTLDRAWTAALDALWCAAWNAALLAAVCTARNAAQDPGWNATRYATWNAALNSARNAISALVVYDHAGKYFDMPSDQMRL